MCAALLAAALPSGFNAHEETYEDGRLGRVGALRRPNASARRRYRIRCSNFVDASTAVSA
jgi:hypothetical protein